MFYPRTTSATGHGSNFGVDILGPTFSSLLWPRMSTDNIDCQNWVIFTYVISLEPGVILVCNEDRSADASGLRYD